MRHSKNFYIETFGCQMNEFDSERIIYLLEKSGFEQVKNTGIADLIVINTCSVREKAENRLFGHIGNLKSLKNSNPELIICIGGCTAQNLKEKILEKFPYVDIVFGTQNIGKLPYLIQKRPQSVSGICDTSEFAGHGLEFVYPGTEYTEHNTETAGPPPLGNSTEAPCNAPESAEHNPEATFYGPEFGYPITGSADRDELSNYTDTNNKANKNLSLKKQSSHYNAGFYNFSRKHKFKAYLPVMSGCNNFCSYCIVPYVRGRERSVDPHIVINKVKDLVFNEEVVEIMLLGQNVNSYGFDFENQDNSGSGNGACGKNVNFALLLNEIAAIKKLKRIRFMTSHPKDFSDVLIEVIRDRKNIMNHIHLPLQAGSDKILGAMNRQYSIKGYIKLYEKIKNAIPDCAITTDIIVGFPGEEEADFRKTLDVIKNLRFNRAFTFLYSLRKGTEAEKFRDHISIEQKKNWFRELLEVQNNISLEENSKLVGSNFEVLVDGQDTKQRGLLKGRMENNNTVNFEGDAGFIGKFANVKITGAKSFYLIGKNEKKLP